MPIEITAAEAGANILAHVAKKRLVRCSGLPGEWRPRQNWLDPVSLLEAIHMDIKGSGDCPVSLMPRWLADCSIELSNGIARKDIYLLAERYGKLLAADAMANADDALRDRWLVFVVKEALASARQIAITNTPYWRMTEASCELALAALIGKESREVAAEAARAARRAAQSAGWDASGRVATAQDASYRAGITPDLWHRADAEEHSAKAAEAAAEAAEAAADAEQTALAGKSYLPQWAAKKAAEAARQAARGWTVAACLIGDRDQAAAEAAGEATLDAYFKKVNHPAHFELISAMVGEGSSPENAYWRMFDRLLDEIAAARAACEATAKTAAGAR
jgi:hypothetical protein